jgi:hypothetical protein
MIYQKIVTILLQQIKQGYRRTEESAIVQQYTSSNPGLNLVLEHYSNEDAIN